VKDGQGRAGKKWHVDATYICVERRWYYFYRAIDRENNLVDAYLSHVRNQAAAEAFFIQAKNFSSFMPEKITTDEESALYPAIKGVFGNQAKHRDSKYINNQIEQDHRAIKSRIGVMKDFKNIVCALKFCTVYEEIPEFFCMRNKSRGERCDLFASKINNFNHLMMAIHQTQK